MSKFLVTSGSHFDPFSYTDLATPIAQSVEAHNATQDAYDTISMETAALAQYLSENEDDSDARALYDSYMARLAALQNGLWERGYSSQARRDLSSARTDYFQKIGPLKGAIERRAKDSEAYWNLKHANPDMVMGRDPGSYGLNDYLRDTNFGRNWYSYNGKEFEAAVGAEIKARAAELKSKGKAANDPELPWVIERLETQGFTNTETNEASLVVDALIDRSQKEREAYYEKHGISLPVQILTESLISRYNTTGAREAGLDPLERNRLLGYGKSGFAQGVLGTTAKQYEDEVYKEDAEKRKMSYQSGLRINEQNNQAKLTRENMILEAMLKGGGDGTGVNTTGVPGATHMGSPVQLTAPTYEEYVKATEKQARKYQNGPVQLTSSDGKSSKPVYDEYEMANEVYGTKARESIRRQFGGYDIALSPKQNGQGFIYTAPDGSSFNLEIRTPDSSERSRYGLGTDPSAVIVYDKDSGEVWTAGTAKVNEAIRELNEQVAGYKAQNANTLPDLDDYLITPEQQKKMRENEEDFESTAPWSEFHEYMGAKNYDRMGSTISITGFERYDDKARENMGRALIASYNSMTASVGKKGKIGKDSRFAIHTVNKGGTTYSGDSTTDLASVLGVDKGTIDEKSILDVSVVLEDFIQGRGYAKDGSAPMVRFMTRNHPGTVFATEPIAFGTVADNLFNEPMRMMWNPHVSPESRIPAMSMSNMIAFILEPCFDPGAARRMSEQESRDWGWMANQLLGVDVNGDYYVPHFTRQDGRETPATAKEVASNKNLREKIEYAVTVKMAVPTMSKFLDAINR